MDGGTRASLRNKPRPLGFGSGEKGNGVDGFGVKQDYRHHAARGPVKKGESSLRCSLICHFSFRLRCFRYRFLVANFALSFTSRFRGFCFPFRSLISDSWCSLLVKLGYMIFDNRIV